MPTRGGSSGPLVRDVFLATRINCRHGFKGVSIGETIILRASNVVMLARPQVIAHLPLPPVPCDVAVNCSAAKVRLSSRPSCA